MEKIFTILDRLGAFLTRRIAFGGVLLMLVVAMVTIGDVILRAFDMSPVVGLNELTEVFFTVAIAACFPAGLTQRIHIKVDLLANRYGPSVIAWLAVAGAVTLFWMFALLASRLSDIAWELTEIQDTTTILEIPTWPFIWMVAVLVAIGAIFQFVVIGVEAAKALHQGEPENEKRSIDGSLALVMIAVILATCGLIWGFDPATTALAGVAQASPAAVAFIIFGLVWALLLLILPIAASTSLLGVIGTALLLGPGQSLHVFGSEAIEFLTDSNISVLPLFLMMGVLASAAGLAEDIYDMANALLGGLRGGLAMATIGGCAGFGAVTGSSIAAAGTIGRVALPEMQQRGYSTGLATGSVAAGGTLGALIPPSGVLVVYSFLTEVSIGKLFVAAVIPGLIAAIFYLLTVSAYVRLAPNSAPRASKMRWAEVGPALRRGTTVIALFTVVLGGIYSGIFTVTESASVGAIGAFFIALFRGRLNGQAFWRVMGQTASITAMVYALIVGGLTLSFFIGITGLPQVLADTVGVLDLAPKLIIALFLVVFVLLGAVMEAWAIMIITVPVLAGLVVDLGFDLVWWGIIMVTIVEVGAITPPFGINVFIIKSMADKDVRLLTVFKGVMPFVLAALVNMALMVLFPALVLWLPSTMF